MASRGYRIREMECGKGLEGFKGFAGALSRASNNPGFFVLITHAGFRLDEPFEPFEPFRTRLHAGLQLALHELRALTVGVP